MALYVRDVHVPAVRVEIQKDIISGRYSVDTGISGLRRHLRANVAPYGLSPAISNNQLARIAKAAFGLQNNPFHFEPAATQFANSGNTQPPGSTSNHPSSAANAPASPAASYHGSAKKNVKQEEVEESVVKEAYLGTGDRKRATHSPTSTRLSRSGFGFYLVKADRRDHRGNGSGLHLACKGFIRKPQDRERAERAARRRRLLDDVPSSFRRSVGSQR